MAGAQEGRDAAQTRVGDREDGDGLIAVGGLLVIGQLGQVRPGSGDAQGRSKENLLLALMEEYLAGQVAEQLELFDRDRVTWERPLAGSDRWMDSLQERPDRFLLFVELWSCAQRDESLRLRLAGALGELRATFARFAADSSADAGLEAPPQAVELFASVMFGLGAGLAMLKLTDPPTVPSALLGGTLSVLIRAMETSPEARKMLAGLASEREGMSQQPHSSPERGGAGGPCHRVRRWRRL